MVTVEWSHFESISRKHKSSLGKLNSETSLIKLLHIFYSHKKKYFLLNHEAFIVGLVSVVNFSEKEIYKRLYNELAELEIQLTDCLFTEFAEVEIFQTLLLSASDVTRSVLGQYLIDQKNRY
jgi:hypothetical protein